MLTRNRTSISAVVFGAIRLWLSVSVIVASGMAYASPVTLFETATIDRVEYYGSFAPLPNIHVGDALQYTLTYDSSTTLSQYPIAPRPGTVFKDYGPVTGSLAATVNGSTFRGDTTNFLSTMELDNDVFSAGLPAFYDDEFLAQYILLPDATLGIAPFALGCCSNNIAAYWLARTATASSFIGDWTTLPTTLDLGQANFDLTINVAQEPGVGYAIHATRPAGTISVPEPTSLSLVVIAFGLVAVRRARAVPRYP